MVECRANPGCTANISDWAASDGVGAVRRYSPVRHASVASVLKRLRQRLTPPGSLAVLLGGNRLSAADWASRYRLKAGAASFGGSRAVSIETPVDVAMVVPCPPLRHT